MIVSLTIGEELNFIPPHFCFYGQLTPTYYFCLPEDLNLGSYCPLMRDQKENRHPVQGVPTFHYLNKLYDELGTILRCSLRITMYILAS